MAGAIAAQLCRECHGDGTVKADCACGCGKSMMVTCRQCGGLGVEPPKPMLSAIYDRWRQWLASTGWPANQWCH